MTPTAKVKLENVSFIVKKSYNKTMIDFNFDRHEDLYTLNYIHLGLAASVGLMNPHVDLIEVNNCIISIIIMMDFPSNIIQHYLCGPSSL